MKHIAVYYRVSTDRQDLSSQKNAVEKWLNSLPPEKKPLSLREYSDEGFSGKLKNRPAYDEMLKSAYNREIDTIVVYRLDRFSRHATHAIRTLLELDEFGVAFISITQPALNLGHENPFRRTLLSAFAEIAEIERDTIVTRILSGLSAARKRGVRLGPPQKLDDDHRNTVIRLRKEGKSMREIARMLSISVGSVHKLAGEDKPT
ncbi:MAG: recombinase family protein [Oligoflexales bacterium]|nr:recombinase family protein [Oligoflexales bacterium]